MSERNELNLAQKIALVMKEVEKIPKNGFNEKHNYRYVTEADAANHLRVLLADKGVVVLPSIAEIGEYERQGRNGKLHITRVRMSYEIINASNTEERYKVEFWGDGQDSLDKGIYKAITGCTKYFLLKTFMVGSDDDPEREEATNDGSRAIRRASANRESIAGANGELYQYEFAPGHPEFPKLLSIARSFKEKYGGRFNGNSKRWEFPRECEALAECKVIQAGQEPVIVKDYDSYDFGDDDIPEGWQ